MAVDRLPAVDVFEFVFLTLDEFIVRKFPPFRIDLPETISVELTDKAGEIVVLEEGGKETGRELRWVPHNEAGVGGTP